MALYALLAPELDPRLAQAIEKNFPESFYRISDTQFLVSAPKLTTSQVYDKIGAAGGTVGRVLILRFASYTGWHSKNLWEWVAQQSSPTPSQPVDPSEPSSE